MNRKNFLASLIAGVLFPTDSLAEESDEGSNSKSVEKYLEFEVDYGYFKEGGLYVIGDNSNKLEFSWSKNGEFLKAKLNEKDINLKTFDFSINSAPKWNAENFGKGSLRKTVTPFNETKVSCKICYCD